MIVIRELELRANTVKNRASQSFCKVCLRGFEWICQIFLILERRGHLEQLVVEVSKQVFRGFVGHVHDSGHPPPAATATSISRIVLMVSNSAETTKP